MAVSKEQAQMIANLAIAARPTGAPRWDAPGVVAVLAKVSQLPLADVVCAVMRAASDRTAETPGVIAATTSLHWREKVAERATLTPPKFDAICHECQRETCVCPSGPVRRPPERADDETRRRAIESVREILRRSSDD